MKENMKLLYTNGENKDFVMLCHLLDDNLNELVGGEKQRKEYKQYNKLDAIHDVFVAYDNETPVGCAAFKLYQDGIAEVKRVFVRKDYRGRGLSKLLMEQIEKKAQERGYRSLILETGKPMKEAIGLYSKIGYQVIENYGQYINMPLSVCMRKDIVE
jgi:putative acetyltransferase